MSNVTRKELAEAINQKLGYSMNTCNEMIDAFLLSMKTSLLSGESIKIVNFGTFSVLKKKERQGRNPKTGESISIKPRKMISFRPSKKIRSLINS